MSYKYLPQDSGNQYGIYAGYYNSKVAAIILPCKWELPQICSDNFKTYYILSYQALILKLNNSIPVIEV